MAASGWGQCSAIAGDETGRLYGVAESDTDPGTSVIWVADVYPDALRAPDAQEASVGLNSVRVSQVVFTSPAIGFDVTAAAASADGHQLLLVGTARQEDAVPVLALVDIYASQPAAASSSSSSSSHPGAKQRLASLIYVHQGLYSERPSMRILQASWHPSSSSHFAALATDNRWRLYHTSRLEEAEQTFALRLPGSQQSIGLRRGGGLAPRFTAFAFGPPGTGWASLAVLFLASNGGVYALCSVAPFGLRMRSGVLQRLLDQSDSTAHAWLLAAFLSVLSHESEVVSARPHMLETAAPALQGPLNKGSESLKLKTTRSIACTIAVSAASSSSSSSSGTGGLTGGLGQLSLGGAGGSAGGQTGFSVVATGFSNGTVYAHALEVGQVLPVWLDATPQCAYDHKGEVAAVRYEVDTVATVPAAAGLTSVQEEGQQSVGDASASVGLLSPLLLLDALKINLHLPPGTSSTADWENEDEDGCENGQSGGQGGPTDSDEESDAGYDPSAAARGVGFSSSTSGRRRASFGGSAAGFGAGGGSRGSGFGGAAAFGGSDDDEADADEDVEDQQLLQLQRVTLHAAPELPGRFWACHDQGCWGINIRWLQQLACKLDAAESGQQQQGWGGGQNGGQNAQQLPAPSLQELLVSGSCVSSSCVVGNALLGSGCVVLEGSGALSFLRPRPAGVLGDGVQGGEGLEGSDEEGLGLADVQLNPEEMDAKGRMEDFYSDICRGPRRLPAPAKPPNLSQLTPADPAGLKYLHDVTSWLLQTHVQYATGAHADMVERVKQLHEEVADQSSAVAALQQLAQSASTRQSDIASRLERLSDVATNLSERAGLLAGLHWALPRPVSSAEQQLDKQLEVWEQRRDQLKVSWRALRARLDAYTAAAAAKQQQQSQATSSWSGFGTPSSVGTGGVGLGAGLSPPLLGTPGAAGTPTSTPFLGVPALAAGRARARAQVTKPPGAPVAAAQLEKLKEMLAVQNNIISEAREKLAALFEEVERFRTVEHPEVELPGKLRGRAVV